MDAFNPSLDEAGKRMAEKWTLQRTTVEYDALSIDTLSVASQVMIGGRFLEIDTMIFLSEAVFTSSGVKDGDVVLARGQELVVNKIEWDGDASRTLLCTGSQIDVMFRR